jgi:hypothetical protein
VYIDYWLRSDATGPVTLEIVDADDRVLQTFTTEPAAQQGGGRGGRGGGRGGGIPNTSPLWRPEPVPFSGSAGMHRAVWNPNTGRGRGFGGFGRGGAQAPVVSLPGTFTARLTANGRSLTQTFAVRPDPRPVGG